AASVVAVGVLGDRVKGKYGLVVLPALLAAAVALALLAVIPLQGRPVAALALICAMSMFLIGPYSLFSGVIALRLGGKRGSSSASGLIDSAGYLGAVLSGLGVEALVKQYGWQKTFGGLAAIAALTAVAAAVYWAAEGF